MTWVEKKKKRVDDNMLLKIEKTIVYRLKRNEPKRKMGRSCVM